MTENYSWSLGTLIWLPIAILLILGFFGLALYGFAAWRRDEGYSSEDYGLVAVGAGLLGAVVLTGTLWGFYPYSAEYHQWREYTGTVDQVDKRIYGGSDGAINERFVVDIDGKSLACDDTRCAGVRKGDLLTVTCKREWQYTGLDGYACNFISNEKKGARS